MSFFQNSWDLLSSEMILVNGINILKLSSIKRDDNITTTIACS